MTWNFVGEHTFTPDGAEVNIGEFNLSEGQDTIWARVTQLNEPGDWPFSFGILSWRSSEGNELGSIKIFPTQFGEVFRLTCGRAPLVGAGSIWFEPRGYNLQWIKAGYPWTLKFEASAGRGALENQIWERAADTIFPVNEGDDLDMKGGCITSGCLKVQPPDEEPLDISPYQQGVWTPTVSRLSGISNATTEDWNPGSDPPWARIGQLVFITLSASWVGDGNYTFDSEKSYIAFKGTPYPGAVNCTGSFTSSAIVQSGVGGQVGIGAGLNPEIFMYGCSSSVASDGTLRVSLTYITDDTTWKPVNGASVGPLPSRRERMKQRLADSVAERVDPDSADLDLEAL